MLDTLVLSAGRRLAASESPPTPLIASTSYRVPRLLFSSSVRSRVEIHGGHAEIPPRARLLVARLALSEPMVVPSQVLIDKLWAGDRSGGKVVDRKPFGFVLSPLVETVFRALAHPTRRELLDSLFERDGQTLTSLTAGHEMTRIGVAKHLQLLEEARLVVTRRRGREKLHYLNPVPIRLVHDRWVSKYTEPWAAWLVGLKGELEEPMEKVFEIYIRTTPERLWEAITDPVIRARYHFGATVASAWTQGSRWRLVHPDADGVLAEGENLVVDPPHRLVQTMAVSWSEDAEREGTSRVTWEIEPVGDSCRLTVTHDQLRDDAPAELYGGWPMILSGLKTWLETGETLTTPGSLMYGKT